MLIEEGLMDAIHADPSDETNWLVLADWLEEKGQPDRAELLRLQRRLRGMMDMAERWEFEERIQSLLLSGVRPCVPVLVNSIGLELALIPAGKFWLGSPSEEEGRYSDESPVHLVEMRKPFYLGVYPVTQEQYERVTGTNPSAFRPGGRLAEVVAGLDTRRHPVEEVNWGDAVSFCQALSALPAERQAGRVYRLPTEAEWEYACRGGAAQCAPFPFGKTMTSDLANFKSSPRYRGVARHTTPVDAYPPNGFGLHDMVGNTWEWCLDWYGSEAYSRNPPHDPPGPADGQRRNARGGTFNLETRRVRCADRSSFDPEQKDSDLGFRVLCEWRPPAESEGRKGKS